MPMHGCIGPTSDRRCSKRGNEHPAQALRHQPTSQLVLIAARSHPSSLHAERIHDLANHPQLEYQPTYRSISQLGISHNAVRAQPVVNSWAARRCTSFLARIPCKHGKTASMTARRGETRALTLIFLTFMSRFRALPNRYSKRNGRRRPIDRFPRASSSSWHHF